MITVDFISPGGAFTPAASGNTQELTTTFSITSGTNALTCDGATPFVSGDTGKYILIDGAGSGGIGGTWLLTTMTYVSSSQVTLGANATKTLSTQSAYIAWGNDDAPASRAFNTWAQAQSDDITLTFGSGSKNFIFTTGESPLRAGSLTRGITHQARFLGNGSGSTKLILPGVNNSFALGSTYYLKSGTGTYPNTSDYTARLDSVAAGSTALVCSTLADAALFSSNTWALLSGLDLMGVGQPPNPFLFEFVYMTNVDTGTGIITIQTGTANAYSDAWPAFAAGNPGLEPDQGGPATLYALDTGWDVDAIFEGMTLYNTSGNQMHTKARKLVFRDVTVPDPFGLIPTGSKEIEFYNCDLTTYQMEVDKITETVIFDNTQTAQLFFQSSINRVVVQNGSNIGGGFNGTPRVLEAYDSSINSLGLGATGFGRSDSVITDGCTFTAGFQYNAVTDSGDVTPSMGGLQSTYTMSGTGLLTMPRLNRDYPGLRWAVPGTKCYFSGQEFSTPFRIVTWGPGFTVLSVTNDANYIYVQTDWPYSGFPSWARTIEVLPSNYFSVGPNTVSSLEIYEGLKEATAAGYTSPGRYRKVYLNGSNLGYDSSSVSFTPHTGGRLISLTIDVTTPYTGVRNPISWGPTFNNGNVLDSGLGFSAYNPRVDIRTAGTRIITPAGVAGTVGADSLSAPPSGAWMNNWLGHGFGTGSNSIASEYNSNPAVGPVMTVELIVSQDLSQPVAVVPLRFRLHG